MEWQLALFLSIVLLLVMFSSGMPVAFGFLTLNLLGLYLWAPGITGLKVVVSSIFANLTSFTLAPVVFFVLMGEIMYRSGVASLLIDAIDQWVGQIRGRLSILAVISGSLFATLSGSSMATTAMLGSVLVPEMRKRGYSASMSLGPIAGSGGLAILIPPTILGVLVATLANVSVGKFLMAIIVPGLVLGIFYLIYILGRVRVNPALAPVYIGEKASFKGRILGLRYILAVGLVIFLVIGVIFLGVATPSEAGALGTVGALILCAIYRKLSGTTLMESLLSSARIIVMVCMILAGSVAFGQVLAYAGVTTGLVTFASNLPVSPVVLWLMMQLIVLFLGCIIDAISIVMITIPMFMPVVLSVGLDPILFSVAILLGTEVGSITPPFGMNLFVMKGVAPENTMGEIMRASFPFVICGVVLIGLLIVFPPLTSWLPGLMK